MSTKQRTNSKIKIDPQNLEAKVQYTNNLDLLYELHQFMHKHPSNCHQLLYFFSDNVQITLDYDKNTTKLCWKDNDTWYLKRYKRINIECFFDICNKLWHCKILNNTHVILVIYAVGTLLHYSKMAIHNLLPC